MAWWRVIIYVTGYYNPCRTPKGTEAWKNDHGPPTVLLSKFYFLLITWNPHISGASKKVTKKINLNMFPKDYNKHSHITV